MKFQRACSTSNKLENWRYYHLSYYSFRKTLTTQRPYPIMNQFVSQFLYYCYCVHTYMSLYICQSKIVEDNSKPQHSKHSRLLVRYDVGLGRRDAEKKTNNPQTTAPMTFRSLLFIFVVLIYKLISWVNTYISVLSHAYILVLL